MEKKNSNLVLFFIILVILILIFLGVFIVMNNNKTVPNPSANNEIGTNTINGNNVENQNQSNNEEIQFSKDINVVASLQDEISKNTAWCGTFQLVWNDMVNNVVRQDVVFTPQLKMVENLNKQTFKEDQLSEKDYYKVFDLMTLSLKNKIEEAIKTKFNETSDVLDKLDWSDVPQDNSGYNNPDYKRYLFYTMLKKEFNFENEFDELDKGTFGTQYTDVAYFGIDGKSDSKLYSQVDILYYNSEDDFAIILNTKEGEQVILAKGAKGNSFNAIYNNVVKEYNNYNGNKKFTENDLLKVPNINFNVLREYKELCNKEFYSADGGICQINQALQTIKVEMDKAGGRIKSEAVIDMQVMTAVADPTPVEYRYFYLDDEFTMFLKEKDKSLPYFAANIENITLFQK